MVLITFWFDLSLGWIHKLELCTQVVLGRNENVHPLGSKLCFPLESFRTLYLKVFRKVFVFNNIKQYMFLKFLLISLKQFFKLCLSSFIHSLPRRKATIDIIHWINHHMRVFRFFVWSAQGKSELIVVLWANIPRKLR